MEKKKKKKEETINWKTRSEMAIYTYVSLITLNAS